MKKLLMLYNPVSGDGRIKASLSDLVDLATKAGYRVTVYPTQFSGDARQTIEREGADYHRIVVCGGDGMMHEAINGWMAGKSMPLLGYVPSGTVNDFASTHEIPRELEAAAKVACGNDWSRLDVGCFNDEYFSYVAAFGVGTSVSYSTPQAKKRRLGSLAYLLEALNTVDFAHWENNCETMKITWKGGETEGDFLYGMVSNSKYVAGTDVFTKDLFNWHDGLLEGLFVRRPMNLVELNTIIGCMTRSDFNNPLFVQVQSPWFDFETKSAAWTLDGEFGGVHDHVLAKAIPSALKLTLPAEHIAKEGSLQHKSGLSPVYSALNALEQPTKDLHEEGQILPEEPDIVRFKVSGKSSQKDQTSNENPGRMSDLFSETEPARNEGKGSLTQNHTAGFASASDWQLFSEHGSAMSLADLLDLETQEKETGLTKEPVNAQDIQQPAVPASSAKAGREHLGLIGRPLADESKTSASNPDQKDVTKTEPQESSGEIPAQSLNGTQPQSEALASAFKEPSVYLIEGESGRILRLESGEIPLQLEEAHDR